jgi:hypothetical protein
MVEEYAARIKFQLVSIFIFVLELDDEEWQA